MGGAGGGAVHEKLDQFLARLKARCLAYLAPCASFVVCAWGDLTQAHASIPQYGTGNEHLGVHLLSNVHGEEFVPSLGPFSSVT